MKYLLVAILSFCASTAIAGPPYGTSSPVGCFKMKLSLPQKLLAWGNGESLLSGYQICTSEKNIKESETNDFAIGDFTTVLKDPAGKIIAKYETKYRQQSCGAGRDVTTYSAKYRPNSEQGCNLPTSSRDIGAPIHSISFLMFDDQMEPTDNYGEVLIDGHIFVLYPL